MKKIWTLAGGALAASFVLVSYAYLGTARTASAQDKDDFANRYVLDARVSLASDNDLTYPTLFGRTPTKATQNMLGLVEVERGKLGATTLDGAVFAFYGEATGDMKTRKSKPFKFLSLYLDEKCPSDQRNAIGRIVYNDPRFQAEKLNTLTTTMINVVRLDEKGAALLKPAPLAAVTVKIGERGSFTVTPIPGGDGINPVALENSHSMFVQRQPIALGICTAKWKDFGRDLDIAKAAGEIHTVRIEGSAAEKNPIEK